MGNDTKVATVGGTKSKTKVVGYRTINGKRYSIEELPQVGQIFSTVLLSPLNLGIH